MAEPDGHSTFPSDLELLDVHGADRRPSAYGSQPTADLRLASDLIGLPIRRSVDLQTQQQTIRHRPAELNHLGRCQMF
jgi:hypothetical protein